MAGDGSPKRAGRHLANKVLRRILRDSSTLSVLVGVVVGAGACLLDMWHFEGKQSTLAGIAGFCLGVALSNLAIRAFGIDVRLSVAELRARTELFESILGTIDDLRDRGIVPNGEYLRARRAACRNLSSVIGLENSAGSEPDDDDDDE